MANNALHVLKRFVALYWSMLWNRRQYKFSTTAFKKQLLLPIPHFGGGAACLWAYTASFRDTTEYCGMHILFFGGKGLVASAQPGLRDIAMPWRGRNRRRYGRR